MQPCAVTRCGSRSCCKPSRASRLNRGSRMRLRLSARTSFCCCAISPQASTSTCPCPGLHSSTMLSPRRRRSASARSEFPWPPPRRSAPASTETRSLAAIRDRGGSLPQEPEARANTRGSCCSSAARRRLATGSTPRLGRGLADLATVMCRPSLTRSAYPISSIVVYSGTTARANACARRIATSTFGSAHSNLHAESHPEAMSVRLDEPVMELPDQAVLDSTPAPSTHLRHLRWPPSAILSWTSTPAPNVGSVRTRLTRRAVSRPLDLRPIKPTQG